LVVALTFAEFCAKTVPESNAKRIKVKFFIGRGIVGLGFVLISVTNMRAYETTTKNTRYITRKLVKVLNLLINQ
jgi:dipeptide/tripeptide permease